MLMGFIWVLLIAFGIGCVLGLIYGTIKAIPIIWSGIKGSTSEFKKGTAQADERFDRLEKWFDNKFGKVDRRYH